MAERWADRGIETEGQRDRVIERQSDRERERARERKREREREREKNTERDTKTAQDRPKLIISLMSGNADGASGSNQERSLIFFHSIQLLISA